MIGGFQTALGGLEDAANLAVLHIVEVAQLEDGALHIWQTGDGFLQLSLDLVAVEIGVGHQRVGDTALIVGTQGCMGLLAAEEVDALINGDTEEPGAQLGVALKGGQRIPGLEEGVLKHVVGIVVIKHHPTDHPIQAFAVLTDHRLKSLTLSGRTL